MAVSFVNIPNVRLLLLLTRHQRRAIPALLKPTFDVFATNTGPAPLGDVLQVVKQFARPLRLRRVVDPDFGQALVGRQFTGGAAEVLALHAGLNPFK